jgi:hypothetical protein
MKTMIFVLMAAIFSLNANAADIKRCENIASSSERIYTDDLIDLVHVQGEAAEILYRSMNVEGEVMTPEVPVANSADITKKSTPVTQYGTTTCWQTIPAAGEGLASCAIFSCNVVTRSIH